LTKLIEHGVVQSSQTTVVVLTGAGLKTTRRIGELLAQPTL
jgi:threonine synthase